MKFDGVQKDMFSLGFGAHSDSARFTVLWVQPGIWIVEYSIGHGPAIERWSTSDEPVRVKRSESNGSVILYHSGVKDAFMAQSRQLDPSHRELAERFGLDTCLPGKYARKGHYLNIPGPGTGLKGDPNLSILVTEEMTTAAAYVVRHAENVE